MDEPQAWARQKPAFFVKAPSLGAFPFSHARATASTGSQVAWGASALNLVVFFVGLPALPSNFLAWALGGQVLALTSACCVCWPACLPLLFRSSGLRAPFQCLHRPSRLFSLARGSRSHRTEKRGVYVLCVVVLLVKLGYSTGYLSSSAVIWGTMFLVQWHL